VADPDGAWSAQLFRDLLESSPEGVVSVDASGQIVLVNAQTERLFGFRREELVGQPVEALMPARLRQRHQGQRADHFADPHPRLSAAGLDLIGARKDGSEFPAEILLSPIRPEQGGPLTLATVRDVSDRKRMESDHGHFAAIVRSSEDAIIGRANDGTILRVRGAAPVCGRRRGEGGS
jgi:PAS domain S-box-containing protein